MQRYSNSVLGSDGRPVVGATVTVLLTSGATPTLYSDNGSTALASNTRTTDSSGEYFFYAANGRYNLTITAPGFTSDSALDALLFDPADAGADEIGYTASGVGAVDTTVAAKLGEWVSVTDYGALGDGSNDDTAEIQAALDTGKNVFVPGTSTYYKITAALAMSSNQHFFGEGTRSQIRQTTALANVVQATSKSGCVVEDIKLYAPGDRSSYIDGAGLIFITSDKCAARNVTVENHRGGGIVLYSTANSTVVGNTFINSPVAHTDDDTGAFADVAVVYDAGGNIVRGNYCISGQGTGVLVQSVTGSNACSNTVVTGNIVKEAKVYGICAYRNEDAYPASQEVRRTVISGNVVDTVYGSIVNSVTGTYTYGTGIYAQGAEEISITGNVVKGTHAYARTFAELLAPGAIGTTNMTRGTITGNIIEDCGMFGIDAGDGNDYGEPIGAMTVSGNVITNTTRGGIHVRRRGRIAITGNTIDTTGDSGIEVNNVALREDIIITGNIIANVTGTSGIEIKYADGITVNGNHINTTSGSGISAANSEDIHINDNMVRDHTVYGIQIASTSSRAEVMSNHVVGTGTSTAGIRLDAATKYGGNRVESCTSIYSGSFGPRSVLTANSTTPSVADGTSFITANTVSTTITNFTNGVQDQEIFVVVRDANTTLDFSSSNLKGNGGVDRAMALNDAFRATYDKTLSAWWVTISAAS